MVYLAHHARVCSSEELAQNICTHPARVRRVLSPLRKRGLLEVSDSGPGSGYRFCGDACRVTLADIAAALTVPFAAPGWRSGSVDRDCLISSGMGPLMDGLFGELNECCYSYLKNISVSDIEHRLFAGNNNEK